MAAASLAPKQALVCLDCDTLPSSDLFELFDHFFGPVLRSRDDAGLVAALVGCSVVYVAGDVCAAVDWLSAHVDASAVRVVSEYSTNYDAAACTCVASGQLPRRVPGIGVLYPSYFENSLYGDVAGAHTFADLTESNKPSDGSYRKGVYITRATPEPDGSIAFKLLRCSTNFANPTDACRPVDDRIIGDVNAMAACCFDGAVELNHVLAQVYTNVVTDGKQRKARIPSHSDKTKDMPSHGLIAFVSLYEFNPAVAYTREGYDVRRHGMSALTTLRWAEKGGAGRKVDVLLSPGSVLLVSLEVNRLFTHEIKPSALPVDLLPTRLGYVVRCSKTDALHAADGATYIVTAAGERVALRKPTHDDMSELRTLYFLENSTSDVIVYSSATHGDVVPYSMNAGDYMAPRL